MQCRAGLHYSVDIRIQTYTKPVPVKYGKLATKYPWILGYFYSEVRWAGFKSLNALLVVAQPLMEWNLEQSI